MVYFTPRCRLPFPVAPMDFFRDNNKTPEYYGYLPELFGGFHRIAFLRFCVFALPGCIRAIRLSAEFMSDAPCGRGCIAAVRRYADRGSIGESLSALSASSLEHLSSVCGFHSLAETVLYLSLALLRLVSSEHLVTPPSAFLHRLS